MSRLSQRPETGDELKTWVAERRVDMANVEHWTQTFWMCFQEGKTMERMICRKTEDASKAINMVNDHMVQSCKVIFTRTGLLIVLVFIHIFISFYLFIYSSICLFFVCVLSRAFSCFQAQTEKTWSFVTPMTQHSMARKDRIIIFSSFRSFKSFVYFVCLTLSRLTRVLLLWFSLAQGYIVHTSSTHKAGRLPCLFESWSVEQHILVCTWMT